MRRLPRSTPSPPIPGPPCNNWTHTIDSYYEACGGSNGDIGTFANLSPEQAQAACCANLQCAGFSYSRADRSGYYKVRPMLASNTCETTTRILLLLC